MKCLEVEILVIRTIVCLFSLSGCIWHLTDISSIYFSYETDVNVDFEREAMVQIPGVSICINSTLTAREDYLVHKFPELVNATQIEVGGGTSQYHFALDPFSIFSLTSIFIWAHNFVN